LGKFTLVPFFGISQEAFCTLAQMKRKNLALIATALALALFGSGALSAQMLMTSRIESRIQSELPKASGVSASIPLADIPQNLTSGTIKSAEINIDKYALKGSNAESSMTISLSKISKSKPTIVGSLDITATIPAATILESSEFGDAQIMGNTLQVSVGAAGLGKAVLVPSFSNNQIYFKLKGISLFGNELPASALPADVQNQIKDKSVRELNLPKGLKLKSVSLSPKGLSINLRGSNIQLGNLGSAL
jgi:hypothetical protein